MDENYLNEIKALRAKAKKLQDPNVDEGIRALLAGTTGIFRDSFRYPALLANYAIRNLGGDMIRSQQVYNDVYRDINNLADNPPFLPDELNAYLNMLASKHPYMTNFGEISGAIGIGSLGVKEAAPYLLQKGSKIGRAFKAHPGGIMALFEATKEDFVEPALDSALRIDNGSN